MPRKVREVLGFCGRHGRTWVSPKKEGLGSVNGAPGRASRPGPGSAPQPVFRSDNPSLQLLHGREGNVVVRLHSRAVFLVDFGANLEPQRGAVFLFQYPFHEEFFEAVAERELRLAKALTEELVLEPLADLEVGDSGGSPSSAQCAYAPELAEEAPSPVTWSAVPWFLARAPGLFPALWGSGGMRLAGTDGLWLHEVMVGSGCRHGQWAGVAGGGGVALPADFNGCLAQRAGLRLAGCLPPNLLRGRVVDAAAIPKPGWPSQKVESVYGGSPRCSMTTSWRGFSS